MGNTHPDAGPESFPAGQALDHVEQMLIDLGHGQVLRGIGPFERAASVGPETWAFYRNDFGLTDPLPWRVPTRLEIVESPLEAAPRTLALHWREPAKQEFHEVFADVMQRINTNQWRKVVPAVTARADWSAAHEAMLLDQWPELGGEAGTHGYAYRSTDGTGCAGQTPEVLFRVENGVLKTMALAGTMPRAEAATMLQNPKLQREHELVVEMLRERLNALGDLEMEPRGLLHLGVMTHLCTRMSVRLDDPQRLDACDALIRLLHPTPALGIAPRTPETLAQLHEYRQRLGVPAMFGAPFGLHWPQGMLMLVAIRGLFWTRDEVMLPAGVGLVAGSDFESEWAELELKRSWVRHALHV